MAALLFPLLLPVSALRADEALTAGVALKTMTDGNLGSYVQGVLEGLAQARYEKDGNTDGMQCMFDWFYSNSANAAQTVVDAFGQYPDHSPGAIMSGLLNKECPS